jgi:hypothetical protein
MGIEPNDVWLDPAPHVDQLRNALGEKAFAEAWAQGEGMTLGDAIAYALDEGNLESRSLPAELAHNRSQASWSAPVT